jgi:hypothetical protein
MCVHETFLEGEKNVNRRHLHPQRNHGWKIEWSDAGSYT